MSFSVLCSNGRRPARSSSILGAVKHVKKDSSPNCESKQAERHGLGKKEEDSSRFSANGVERACLFLFS